MMMARAASYRRRHRVLRSSLFARPAARSPASPACYAPSRDNSALMLLNPKQPLMLKIVLLINWHLFYISKYHSFVNPKSSQ
jgi:hypothetical protein